MTKKASPTTTRTLEEIAGTIRVTEVTSSFALEGRHEGLGASSFVSYTVKSSQDRPDGWTMDESRIVEAMLAKRVSKDLYADLAARKLVNIPTIAQRQKEVTRQYDKLIEKLGANLESEDSEPMQVEVKESANG